MTDTVEVDLVVVGLGPGAETLASGAAQAGLRVVALDKHLVGGECPYYGCVPSKMMVRAADLLAEAGRVGGMAGEAAVTPAWGPVAERIAEEATSHWDDQVAVDRLVDAGITFHHGIGRLDGAGRVTVELPDGSAGPTYVATRGVVLNTGTRPAVPPVPGLEDTPYWTNRDAVQVTDLPGVADRGRRRADRGRDGAGLRAVRGAGDAAPARCRGSSGGSSRRPASWCRTSSSTRASG